MIRVDAHQHFWSVARGDYPWLTREDYPRLYRDFGPSDLAPLLERARMERSVLVQGAETVDETLFLLSIAEETPFVAGVVGWVDFAAEDAPAQIARLAQHEKLVSLRPMLQDMEDKAWMLRPDLAPAFQALQRHDLKFDALIKPPHLPHMPAFLAKYPDLPIVIDHGAKPYIATGEMEPWTTQIRAIAKHGNLYCKLSGLATEAGESWDAAKLKPYVDVLIEVFGPARLMWGSDWPVLVLAGDYVTWFDAAEALTLMLSAADRDLIFGGTAAKFYGLQDG